MEYLLLLDDKNTKCSSNIACQPLARKMLAFELLAAVIRFTWPCEECYHSYMLSLTTEMMIVNDHE